MTMKARAVLSDCKLALEELRVAIADRSKDYVRIRWFTCLALLRAVGHILHKVDGASLSSKQRNKSDELFRKWKNEPIFKNFIEEERNLILKEYKCLIDITQKKEEFYLVTESGDRIVTEQGDAIVGASLKETIDKISGYSKNCPPDQIIDDAINWWEKSLIDYENELKIA
jgi:hypothetical protein